MAREKEFDAYGQRNDHANGEELMVEITLAEYRQLVHNHAVSESEKEKLRSRLYETEQKLKAAQEKLVAIMTEADRAGTEP